MDPLEALITEMAKERGIYGDAYATAEMAMDEAESIAAELGVSKSDVYEWALTQRDKQ